MGLPIDRLSRRLPRRFPVGATYVVEGYGGEEGNLRVIARYIVLPGSGSMFRLLVFPSRHRLQSHSMAPILSDPRTDSALQRFSGTAAPIKVIPLTTIDSE